MCDKRHTKPVIHVMRTFITHERRLKFWHRNRRKIKSVRPDTDVIIYQPATQQNPSTTNIHISLLYSDIFHLLFSSPIYFFYVVFFSSVVVTPPATFAFSNMSFRHAMFLLFFPILRPEFSSILCLP